MLEHDHAKLRNIWAERMKARMDEKEASCTERDTFTRNWHLLSSFSLMVYSKLYLINSSSSISSSILIINIILV